MFFLRNYSVATVMALVAATQLFVVQTQGLVSWRAGGFGMYASFHPRHHEAWVTTGDGGEPVRYTKYDAAADCEVYRAIRHCLTWPSNLRLDEALLGLPEELRQATRVRIYRLNFDPSSGVLSRKLLAESPRTAPSGAR
ncbi:MAG: hypothetical protein AAGJ46_17515 [Planctomycetota bacterium]